MTSPTFPNANRDRKAQAAADKAYAKSVRPWFKKKRFILPLILIVLFIVITVSNHGGSDSAASTSTSTNAAVNPAVKAKAAAALGTVSQQNAQKSAESYLDMAGFSRSGLIHQLVFEKFSTEDATWGVDHAKADWNSQAAKSAKSYLDTQAFSHAGLVHQLTFEGFTPEQAEYGTTQAGL